MGKPSVCIVGAGVVGLCSADTLLDRGHEVTIVDCGPAGKGSSYGNGGLIVPSHIEPLATPGLLKAGIRMMLQKGAPFGFAGGLGLHGLNWILRFARFATQRHVESSASLLCQMHLASRALYEQLGREMQFKFEQHGLAMVCQTERGLESEEVLAEHAGRLGLAHRSISSTELVAGALGTPIRAAGGVFFEDDAQLSPSAFMDALAKRVERKGARRLDASVVGFESENGGVRAAVTTREPIDADEFVLCAGVWTRELADELGVACPLLAGRGCGFTGPAMLPRLSAPTILTDGRIAVTPYGTQTRFVGLMELGAPGWSCSPARIDKMRSFICGTFPEIERGALATLPVWVGNRPCPPDGMPIIGRPQRWKNVVLATGHGMMGMSLGPITGNLVGEILDEGKTSIEIGKLSPDRF